LLTTAFPGKAGNLIEFREKERKGRIGGSRKGFRQALKFQK
jgi:hypothetical protein